MIKQDGVRAMRILFLLGLALLAACGPVNPQLTVGDMTPQMVTEDRIAQSVSFRLTQDSSRDRSVTKLPTRCLGVVDTIPADYGTPLADVVARQFTQIFVASRRDARDADVILEVALADVGRKASCGTDPNGFFEIAATLRALDRDGKEIWRSGKDKYRAMERSVVVMTADRDQSFGKAILETMRQMAAEWAKELTSAQAFAAARTAPPLRVAPAPVAQPPVASAPLSTPAPDGGRRLALVIGNGDYRMLGRLRNPVNDARAVSASLRRLGFEVTSVENGGRSQMMRALADFGGRVPRDGIGLFYYAGHAVQIGGENFLIPVDADIKAESEVEYLAVNAGYALAQFERSGPRVGIVVLDACRDNPLQTSFRSASRGLAVTAKAPPGLLVVYATAPGQVAQDGDGANGLFTAEMLRHIETPGVKIQDVMNRVAVGVRNQTGGRQSPWINSTGIEGDFYFRDGAGGGS